MRLKDLKVGTKVTCEIRETKITDAKIQIENRWYYICQNEEDGMSANNKLGYKYSWCLSCLTNDEELKEELAKCNVTNLKIIKKDIMKDAKFGVTWEDNLDQTDRLDPTEFFTTREAADKGIAELLEKFDVTKDSIYLFEVGKVYKATRPISYKLVEVKDRKTKVEEVRREDGI